MVVFSLLNDFILITQFKDDLKKQNQKNFHSLITCSLDCRFYNCGFCVKALLNDFILITQFKGESFQNKTKKPKQKIKNSLTKTDFPWPVQKSSFSLTCNKIPWLFHDLEKIFFSLTFSLTVATLTSDIWKKVYKLGKIRKSRIAGCPVVIFKRCSRLYVTQHSAHQYFQAFQSHLLYLTNHCNRHVTIWCIFYQIFNVNSYSKFFRKAFKALGSGNSSIFPWRI